MKKEQRIEMLKKKRKNHKKYSPNKYLNYKIHQMNNRTARNEKGHGCAMRALDTLRKKYPDLLTPQAGGNADRSLWRNRK